MNYTEEIANLKKNTPNLIAVSNAEWYSLFRDEIRNSIAIEGVFTNRSELLDVLEHNKRTDSQKMASILGYFEAASTMYEYANNQHKENEFALRMADIKQIHTLLMRYEKERGHYLGDIGEFRKANIEVSQATFKAIDVYAVRDAMQCLIAWVNHSLKQKNCDPVRLAAATHVWFETIHPFRDGNGRAGRILLSYMLVGCGLINIAIKGISEKNRTAYYTALEAGNECAERVNVIIEEKKDVSNVELDVFFGGYEFLPFIESVEKRLLHSIRMLQKASRVSADPDALVPLRDAARITEYSPDYLRNLINRGKVSGEKRGKLWHVRVRDLYAYMQQGN